MATSKTWTQELIICYHCENPALRFCNNCQCNLCNDCLTKHVNELDSLSHDIVPFKNKNYQLVFPECKIHKGHRCEAYCQQCDTSICTKCFIGPHKGHDAEEITSIVDRKNQEIQKETEEIDAVLLIRFKRSVDRIKTTISEVTKAYTKKKREIEILRKVWHQEVDNIFDKSCDLMNAIKTEDLDSLKIKLSQLQSLIIDLNTIVQNNKKTLNSKDSSNFINFRSSLSKYKEISTQVDVKNPPLLTDTVQGKELRIEIDKYRANLSSSTSMLLNDVRVTKTISVNYNPLCNVACIGKDEAWISGWKKSITRVNIHGSIQETITCNNPCVISMTKKGELVYSENKSGAIYIVREDTIENPITTPRGWKAKGLCCTRLGNILVNLHKLGRNKIVCYNDNIITEEIDKDIYGNPIFRDGPYRLDISENNNGDICVIDSNAKIVMGINLKGCVRFRYDGVDAERIKTFEPRFILTDKMNQIIVTDSNNDCLHILDQNGSFLKCVDHCELEEPGGLSVDSEGRLWVALFLSRKIKVIQYVH